MHLRRFVCLAVVAATAVLAFGAASASSGAATSSSTASAATNKIGVKYTVKKFARRGHHLVAYGTTTVRYIPASGSVTTSKKPFVAVVAVRGRHTTSTQTICPVLDLILGPLDLNLLGAMIHLDQVHLTITANSDGGLLGSLLCGLTKSGKLTAQTKKLNWTLQHSGLSTTGAGLVVALQPTASGGSSSGSTPNASVGDRHLTSAQTICSVLDLTLGPIHLDLLGLIVDTNTIHLTITADSEGGVLGSLLCSLAGGG